jgi:hypothetical protein
MLRLMLGPRDCRQAEEAKRYGSGMLYFGGERQALAVYCFASL